MNRQIDLKIRLTDFRLKIFCIINNISHYCAHGWQLWKIKKYFRQSFGWAVSSSAQSWQLWTNASDLDWWIFGESRVDGGSRKRGKKLLISRCIDTCEMPIIFRHLLKEC